MTSICRIPLQPNHAPPKLDCTIHDGYMIVQVPLGTPIFDTADLCRYPGCRKRVAIGLSRETKLQYCDGHAQYARDMQRKNYARQQDKIKNTGLCAQRNCNTPRKPNSKKKGALGRFCVEHARLSNERAKKSYRKRKTRGSNKLK